LKVGIMTLYYKNYNFGGLLQAYALQKVLSKEGFHSLQISYDFRSDPIPRESLPDKIKRKFEENGIRGVFKASARKLHLAKNKNFIVNERILAFERFQEQM